MDCNYAMHIEEVLEFAYQIALVEVMIQDACRFKCIWHSCQRLKFNFFVKKK